MITTDRRARPRYTAPGAAVQCYRDELREPRRYNFAVELRDLSVEGACIESVGALRPSVRFVLDVRFPGEMGWLRAKARVCWSREADGRYETGLQFLGRPLLFGSAPRRWFQSDRT